MLPPLPNHIIRERRHRLRDLRRELTREIGILRHLLTVLDKKTAARKHRTPNEPEAVHSLPEALAEQFAKLAALEAEALAIAAELPREYRRPRPALRVIHGRC